MYKIQNVQLYISLCTTVLYKTQQCMYQLVYAASPFPPRFFPSSPNHYPTSPTLDYLLPFHIIIHLWKMFHCIFVRFFPSTRFIFWICFISTHFNKLCIYFFWLKSMFGICFLSLKLPPTDSLCPPLDSPMENSNLSFTMKFRG